jgi:hypothetical protein
MVIVILYVCNFGHEYAQSSGPAAWMGYWCTVTKKGMENPNRERPKKMQNGVNDKPRVLLDSAQVKARLGLSEHQLVRMRATRRIGYLKRGGRILYAEEEVERVLRECEVPALRPVVELGGKG